MKDWQQDVFSKYRKDIGCKNMNAHVCWCKRCVILEGIILDTTEDAYKYNIIRNKIYE